MKESSVDKKEVKKTAESTPTPQAQPQPQAQAPFNPMAGVHPSHQHQQTLPSSPQLCHSTQVNSSAILPVLLLQ